MSYNRYQQGSDGKTAYQHQTGPLRRRAIPFGETVFYRESRTKTEKKQVIEVKWHEGLWLGHVRSNQEVLIGTEDGVVRAWTVRRLIQSQRWTRDAIMNMKETPTRSDPNVSGMDAPIRTPVHLTDPTAEVGPIRKPA